MDIIETRYPGSAPYGIWGCSLGAAIAVQTMAVDHRFCCGVFESCFADFRQIAHDYARRISHVPFDFVSDMALQESERIARFQVDSVSPRLSALKISNPVLFIHGLKDVNISSVYGKIVFDNIKSSEKVWYALPEAAHNNIMQIGGTKYYRTVTDFFKKNLH